MIKPWLLALALLVAVPGIGFAAEASSDKGAAQAPAGAKPAHPQHVTTSYGYALFGDLKYPANFTHFAYVNPDAPKGGTVHVTGYGSYDSFNAFALRGSSAISVLNYFLYYDGLMRASADVAGQYYCLVCETISYPDDFSWVEFKLRKNARWHDGQPITADDVVFSFDALKNHSAPTWANPLAHIVKAEKTGPLSVRFYADAPNNRHLPLSFSLMMILPKHFWQGKDFTEPLNAPPLSSGPYEISSFDFGRSYTLTRVKDYWGKDLPVNRGQYNYDTIVYDYYRDSVAQYEAFKAGYSDIRIEILPCRWMTAYNWPAVQRHQVIKSYVSTQQTPMYEGFYFNMRRPEYRDPALREALSYALDFTWLNQNLSCNQYVPINSLFANSDLSASGPPTADEIKLLAPYRTQLPPEVFTSAYKQPMTDGTQESLRDNLRKGAEILQKAGYAMKDGKLISPKTGKPVEFEVLLWDVNLERPTAAWINNLKLLGVNATMRTIDFPSYIKRMRNYDFQAILGLLTYPPTLGEELRTTFTSAAADAPGSANWSNWAGIKDPVIDDLVEKIIQAKTKSEYLTAAHALDRVFMWRHYTVPIYARPNVYPIAYWDRFGRPDAKLTSGSLAYLTSWWVDPQKDAALKASRGTTN